MLADNERIIDLPGGQRIGVAIYGDAAGQPVLAFHGAPACRLMFATADAEARRQGLKLIAPDRPGYGLSPRDDLPGMAKPTLASRTAAHMDLAEALGLDRFAVLGISGGAPYATALAARLGSRATALALVSPMGPIADQLALPPSERPHVSLGHRIFFQRWPLKRRWVLTWGGNLGRRMFLQSPDRISGLLGHLFGAADQRLLRQRNIADSLVAMTREAVAGGIEGALADLDIYARPWGLDYAGIAGPAVLWQGTADKVVPAAVAVRLARQIPGCRLISLPGAGHFWVLGRIRDVLAEINALLARPLHNRGLSPSATGSSGTSERA